MNKKVITFSIIILWLVISLGFIGLKQYTISTGKKVLLETVPVDPRDFLRGDYVILNYKISNLDFSKLVSFRQKFDCGKNFYVKLEQRGKYWEAIAINKKEEIKKEDVIIKGKVRHGDRVEYGIENYFIPEGKGKEIEQSMRRGSGNTVSVEAIVDKFGNAIINKLYINDKEVKFE